MKRDSKIALDLSLKLREQQQLNFMKNDMFENSELKISSSLEKSTLKLD